jgi:uncharacterized protein
MLLRDNNGSFFRRSFPQGKKKTKKDKREGGGEMAISKELLEIMACPQCRGKVRWEEKLGGLICDQCQLLYEVKNDIPIMLIEKAKRLP